MKLVLFKSMEFLKIPMLLQGYFFKKQYILTRLSEKVLYKTEME